MTPATPESRIAAALDLIADETGMAHWRDAAALLKVACGANKGRPPVDDSAALTEIAGFVESGICVETAARWVANAAVDPADQPKDKGQFYHTNRATARRYARKFRSQAQK
jgi:hypothetical protein